MRWCEGEGDCAVNAYALSRTVASAPKGEIDFTLIDNTLASIGGISLPIQSASDYPRLPDVPEGIPTTYDPEELRDALMYLLPAVSSDVSRNIHGMAWIDSRIIATDGYRMHIVEDLPPGPTGVPIPKAGVELVCRAIRAYSKVPVEYYWGPTLAVRVGPAIVTSSLIDAGYPSWENVVPHHTAGVRISSRDLQTVSAESTPYTDERQGLFCHFDQGQADFRASNEAGSYERSIHCESNGFHLEIWLNPRYLVDALRGCELPTIMLELGGLLDPIIVRTGAGRTAVIMPMKP